MMNKQLLLKFDSKLDKIINDGLALYIKKTGKYIARTAFIRIAITEFCKKGSK